MPSLLIHICRWEIPKQNRRHTQIHILIGNVYDFFLKFITSINIEKNLKYGHMIR